jgi:hypothetical protein
VRHHLGGYSWQRFHQEVGYTHPSLNRAKGVLPCLAPQTHLSWMFVEPALRCLKNVLTIPSGNGSIFVVSNFGPHLPIGGERCLWAACRL